MCFCENCEDLLCYGRMLCQFNSLVLWEGSYRLSATSVFCAVPRVLTVGVLSCPLNTGRALPVPLLAADRIQRTSHWPSSQGTTVHQLSEIPSGLTDSIDAYGEYQAVFREPASLPKDEQVTLAGTCSGLWFLKLLFQELRLISQCTHPLCHVHDSPTSLDRTLLNSATSVVWMASFLWHHFACATAAAFTSWHWPSSPHTFIVGWSELQSLRLATLTVSSPSAQDQFMIRSPSARCQFTIRSRSAQVNSRSAHRELRVNSRSAHRQVTVSSRSAHRQLRSVHDPLTINSRSVHDPLTVSSQSVHDPRTVNSRSVHDPLTVNSRSLHDPLTFNSRPVHDPFTVSSQSVHDPLTVNSRSVHGLQMVRKNIDCLHWHVHSQGQDEFTGVIRKNFETDVIFYRQKFIGCFWTFLAVNELS